MALRSCIKCKTEKDITDFGFYEPNRRRNICKKCQNEYGKQYRKNNPDFVIKVNEHRRPKLIEYRKMNRGKRNEYLKQWGKNNPDKKRAQKYRNRYKIDLDCYNELFEKQNGKCAVCGSNNLGKKNAKYFTIDHDHENGNIRGLLCYKCNALLGLANDNIKVLQSAIEYLMPNEIFSPKN